LKPIWTSRPKRDSSVNGRSIVDTYRSFLNATLCYYR